MRQSLLQLAPIPGQRFGIFYRGEMLSLRAPNGDAPIHLHESIHALEKVRDPLAVALNELAGREDPFDAADVLASDDDENGAWARAAACELLIALLPSIVSEGNERDRISGYLYRAWAHAMAEVFTRLYEDRDETNAETRQRILRARVKNYERAGAAALGGWLRFVLSAGWDDRYLLLRNRIHVEDELREILFAANSRQRLSPIIRALIAVRPKDARRTLVTIVEHWYLPRFDLTTALNLLDALKRSLSEREEFEPTRRFDLKTALERLAALKRRLRMRVEARLIPRSDWRLFAAAALGLGTSLAAQDFIDPLARIAAAACAAAGATVLVMKIRNLYWSSIVASLVGSWFAPDLLANALCFAGMMLATGRFFYDAFSSLTSGLPFLNAQLPRMLAGIAAGSIVVISLPQAILEAMLTRSGPPPTVLLALTLVPIAMCFFALTSQLGRQLQGARGLPFRTIPLRALRILIVGLGQALPIATVVCALLADPVFGPLPNVQIGSGPVLWGLGLLPNLTVVPTFVLLTSTLSLALGLVMQLLWDPTPATSPLT